MAQLESGASEGKMPPTRGVGVRETDGERGMERASEREQERASERERCADAWLHSLWAI